MTSQMKTALLTIGAVALLLLTTPARVEAQVCPAGYRWTSYGQRCVRACPPGQFFNYVRGVCQLRTSHYRACGANHYWHAGYRRCVRRAVCPTGFYFSYSLNRCQRVQRACAYGHYFDMYANVCRPRCPSGWRWNGTRCEANCPAGTYYNARIGRCVAAHRCGPGTYWNGTYCVAAQPSCPADMYWDGTRCMYRSVSAPPPPVMVAPPQPVAMAPGPFHQLVRTVRGQAFSGGKLSAIRLAAAGNYFTCAQVARLIHAVTFSSDKVGALRLLAPRLVDRTNSFVILNAFTFSSDKRRARRILGQ